MTKNYYLICSAKSFKRLASRIAYILDLKPRFYPDRCFMGEINLYHSEGTDNFYGLVNDGAITTDVRVLAGTLQRRLQLFEGIAAFVVHIHPPRYLVGFVFNLEQGTVFMWEGFDNFMPLIASATNMYPITDATPSLGLLMDKFLAIPSITLDWCLYRVNPLRQEQWANMPLYIMYATTTETMLPGALVLPAAYYEDMPDSDYQWAEIINTIYTPLARVRKAYEDSLLSDDNNTD